MTDANALHLMHVTYVALRFFFYKINVSYMYISNRQRTRSQRYNNVVGHTGRLWPTQKSTHNQGAKGVLGSRRAVKGMLLKIISTYI